jgi:dipeptidyl aminopeptidase/acylaminoacyl peptidase
MPLLVRPPLGRRAVRTALACIAALAVLGGAPAQGRPVRLEDLLQRETFGAISLAPGGRWLLVEQRGPYASGARFDFGSYNELFNTRLMVADLARGGGLRPLFRADRGTGYRAGPISPDGAHAVIYRLTASRWEMGIATLASGRLRWLGFAPDILPWDQSLQWVSPTNLLVIADAPGIMPYELRVRRPGVAIPPLWDRSARGGTAVMAVGSGAYITNRPRMPPRRLLRVSAATGASEILATGDWVDLEVSPDRQRVALIGAAEDVTLAAGRPLQGDYGLALRRTRLRILDLRTGALASPCPDCDVMTSPLSWSPQGDELLAYARSDGAPWTDGHWIRVHGAGGAVEKIDAGIQAAMNPRPERVAGGWLGADPLLFGTPKSGGRPDWYRLTPRGPVNLTADLKHPTATNVVATPQALLSVADGRLWRSGPDGRAVALMDQAFDLLPDRPDWTLDRTPYTVKQSPAVTGILQVNGQTRAVRIDGGGRVLISVPAPGLVAALGEHGAVLDRSDAGPGESLTWMTPGGSAIDLARINVRQAGLDRPQALAILHPGAGGKALKSWIFLPALPPNAPPPPLVVVPYPGASRPAPPDLGRSALMDPTATLLGHGYAVLLPSLPVSRDGTGPAEGLASRVTAIVDAAARQPDLAGRFDPTRLGLWGHSFGAYGAVAIIGQSDRFLAAVAAAPATDLISDWGQAGQRRSSPDEGLYTPWTAGWVEASQADMRRPPWEDPERYLRNSPLMMAGSIHTPLLLVYGELDGSHPGQAEEMFSALFRQNKDAILLTYWGEQHLFASPGNLRDYYGRGLRFLDHYLRRPEEPRGLDSSR